jgi:hypothetical protein
MIGQDAARAWHGRSTSRDSAGDRACRQERVLVDRQHAALQPAAGTEDFEAIE